ncbi:hypothetical protein C5167_051006 [Papaver somniferum]|uniref:Uncharacterized protein n=1 Tax=Papaver somniferum TaxID=3469 RepID=A0A4Y7KSZ1_PAPSO|nr:hypothetical protein C5167_051006 [Papaver somniferum]
MFVIFADLSNMVNVIVRYIYYECLASNKLERLIAGAAAYGTPKYQDAFTSFIDMVNGKLGNP